MRYVLLQAPKAENEYSGQIVIIDNSTRIGKGRVQNLINEGYTPAGFIESDLRPQQLKSGFEHDMQARFDNAREIFNKINGLADSFYATL